MKSVSALICSNGKRPQLLRTAVKSILGQDYPGPLQLLVVFDQTEPDSLEDIEVPPGRSLKIMVNERQPGLAGARNSGILAAEGEVIAFCDDDDYWFPSKLSRQLELWERYPQAAAISSGIRLRSSGQDHDRLAPALASFQDFLRSRIAAIHPSAMLYRREDLTGRLGLVDEDLPAAYGEDYDLLLRASRLGDIRSLPEPQVLVLWDRPSFFAGHWQKMAQGLTYLLVKFPEFESCPAGLARISGQVAFAYAALGQKGQARAYARAALHRNPREPRAWLALAMTLGILGPQPVLGLLKALGKGI